jgi:hypothetical protein
MTLDTRILIRLLTVALLGAATALLVTCGGTGAGLIPSANAGPLKEDFEAVAKAAEAGNGSCAKTEEALGKTEEDFLALPATIDRGLHKRLEEGIKNLRKQALAMCDEPTATNTSTTTTQTKTTPATGTTSTEATTGTETTTTPPTPTNTTTTPPTATTPPSPGGGVEAPEEGSGGQGAGAGTKEGAAEHGGAGAGAREGAGNGGSNSGGASAGGGQ